jgi:ABC-type glutathione transport system ATPase component
VTLESFTKWAAGFEAERKQKAKQDVNDQLKALPLKEREAMRAYIAKLSGGSRLPSVEHRLTRSR